MKDYGQLVKFRLTFTVVMSSALGYLLGMPGSIEWVGFIALIIGGFLVVSASNGINQMIEKDYDKLMTRTQNRPLAQNRLSLVEAGIFCAVTGILGVSILGLYLNIYAALLGFSSLMIYAFVYTPMKRISSLAVLIGAIPGAIPPLLGWVAASGSFSAGAWALFFIQFMWQFPHFWSIAWILDEDYAKAGYRLLPYKEGKSKKSAMSVMTYTAILLPLGAIPFVIGITGVTSLILVTISSIILFTYAVKLYNSLDVKDAKRLMFASILYNPLTLIFFILDKV
jgi:protoheme IX farnesyltransferase